MKNVRKYRTRLVRVFKQLFSIFLKLRVSEKMCENTYNIV